jgi:hypothetical protein
VPRRRDRSPARSGSALRNWPASSNWRKEAMQHQWRPFRLSPWKSCPRREGWSPSFTRWLQSSGVAHEKQTVQMLGETTIRTRTSLPTLSCPRVPRYLHATRRWRHCGTSSRVSEMRKTHHNAGKGNWRWLTTRLAANQAILCPSAAATRCGAFVGRRARLRRRTERLPTDHLSPQRSAIRRE